MSTNCCVNPNAFAVSSTLHSQNSVFCFVLFDSASRTSLLLSGSWRSSVPSQSKLKWKFDRSWTSGSGFYSSLPFLSGGQPCNPNQNWSQNLAVPWQVLSIRILSCQIVKCKLHGTGMQAIAFSTCSACRKTITDLWLWKRICNLCLQKTSGPRLTPRAYCFLKTSVANSLYQPRSVIPIPAPNQENYLCWTFRYIKLSIDLAC